MAHLNNIKWINPDEREIKSCLANAIYKALKDNPPNMPVQCLKAKFYISHCQGYLVAVET